MRLHHSSTPASGNRDAALRKLRILNRWLIAGSVTLTGVLAEVAAHAFPGRTVRTADTTGGARHAGAGATSPRHATQPLQAPAHAPQTASSQAPTMPQPTQEAAPTQETTPAHEAAPAQEPTHETAPAPEPAQEPAPVVSGGS